MSIILESQPGDDLITLQEFHASPHGAPFSWSTSRTFRLGERVRYVSYYRDEEYREHPGLGWMVVVEAADGKQYSATQTQFVTEDCWEELRAHFGQQGARRTKVRKPSSK